MTVKPAESLISPNCKSLWLVEGAMLPILIVPEGEDDATQSGTLFTPSACSMAVLSTGQRLNGAQSPLSFTDAVLADAALSGMTTAAVTNAANAATRALLGARIIV